MAEITKMVTGIVLMAIVISGFTVFFTGGTAIYTPTDYDNSTLITLSSSLNDVNSTTNEVRESLFNLQGGNVLDLLGAFFSAGYNSLKLMAGSVSTFFKVIFAGIGAIPLGAGAGGFANVLISGLISIVLLAFIAVLFRAIFKVDV